MSSRVGVQTRSVSVEVFQCKPSVSGYSEGDIVRSELSTSFSSGGKSSSICGELTFAAYYIGVQNHLKTGNI